MAGRPKDPTVNQKVFNAIDDILSKQHYHDMTVDQIANQSGVRRQRFIDVGLTSLLSSSTCFLNRPRLTNPIL